MRNHPNNEAKVGYVQKEAQMFLKAITRHHIKQIELEWKSCNHKAEVTIDSCVFINYLILLILDHASRRNLFPLRPIHHRWTMQKSMRPLNTTDFAFLEECRPIRSQPPRNCHDLV